MIFMQVWVLHVISLSHIPITHLDNNGNNNVSPFFSVINYVQKNSPSMVKFNFCRSDIWWCGKLNVNPAK